ncbi:DUF1840 domain-containing protein [Methylophaga pinxianii]|uniref:DUF1840 domain-containing protein n=1 Tax=Methylophaga pinxianii TaxID=2881052 RepID=UPI001CF3AC98|nr:DUF1840 domain-containing protein [Methylophaga pinxianii]MCB2427704.1 DUF1840 domain-containing protein [Methylophaga pinxianii]UPH46207.1 DUF1840 domain-containing protein [Methylophaga pinxianii]
MIVTFSTKAYADITMFGDVAKNMLKIMGHSGTIPGAFQPQDLPSALSHLQKAVDSSKAAEQDPQEGEFKPGLSQRALPLINLLKAAIDANADVMWDGK